ncbi:MAG: 50S ribosomal protein L25 [Armatimonadota bacterium]
MARMKLETTIREKLGKNACGKIRREGNIPATLYGKGEALSISLKLNDFKEILRTPGGRLSMIDMKIGSEDTTEVRAMVQAIQRNPVTDRIIHVDFHRILTNEPVNAEVPIVLVGDAPGTKLAGILEHLVTDVNVKGLPDNIPSHIDIDISSMELGDKLFIRDVKVPADVEITGPSLDTLVVAIHMPTIRVEATAPVAEPVSSE